jgi:hypothetical protein
MTDLVTTAEARIHLRADTADDGWLAIFIPAISEAVLRWLKEDWRAYVTELDADGNPVIDSNGDEIPVIDSNGERTVKPVVKAAVLVELAGQFRYREGEGADNVVPSEAGHGYMLNKGATALLASLRKSTLA